MCGTHQLPMSTHLMSMISITAHMWMTQVRISNSKFSPNPLDIPIWTRHMHLKFDMTKVKLSFPFSDLLFFSWQWLHCLPQITKVCPSDFLVVLFLILHHQPVCRHTLIISPSWNFLLNFNALRISYLYSVIETTS